MKPSEGMASVVEMYGECLDGVSLVTLAPELPGALSAISGLAGRGVAVSMGHTMATIDEGLAGSVSGSLTYLVSYSISQSYRQAGRQAGGQAGGQAGTQSGTQSSVNE